MKKKNMIKKSNDNLYKVAGMLLGGATAGLGGAIIGGTVGYLVDEEDKKKKRKNCRC